MTEHGILTLVSIFTYILETAIFCIFLRKIHKRPGYRLSAYDTALYIAGFLALAIVYLPSLYESALLERIAYRFLCYTLIIRSIKHPHITRAIYYALVFTSVHTAFMVFWTLPSFMPISRQWAPFGNPTGDAILIRVILKESFFLLIVTVFCRCFTFAPILEGMGIRNLLASTVLFSGVFIRYTLLSLQNVAVPSVISAYAGLVEMFSLVILVSVDHSQHRASAQKALVAEEAITRYRLESLQAQAKAEENLQAFRHDIKNHIISVSQLLDFDDIASAKEYLKVLLGITTFSGRVFHTGNEIVNGLLAQKAELAAANQIRLECNLDLSPLDYSDYGSFAICTIIGNVLDNAFEAAMKVENRDARFVALSSQESGGFISVTVSNSYNGITKRVGAYLTTTKSSGAHGLGLRNVTKVIRKYGGNMTFDDSDSFVFRITLLFPVHDKEVSGYADQNRDL